MKDDFSKLLFVAGLCVAGFFGYQQLKHTNTAKNLNTKSGLNSDVDLGRASFSPEFAKKLVENKERNSPEKVKQAIKKLVD